MRVEEEYVNASSDMRMTIHVCDVFGAEESGE